MNKVQRACLISRVQQEEREVEARVVELERRAGEDADRLVETWHQLGEAKTALTCCREALVALDKGGSERCVRE